MPQITPAAAAPQNDSMHDMPVQTRAATLVPSTFRESDNSLEVTWTTGARRRAYDWFTDQVHEEELAVTEAEAELAVTDPAANPGRHAPTASRSRRIS